jgi:spore germination cell wall hydrolase CwlJ-like protein
MSFTAIWLIAGVLLFQMVPKAMAEPELTRAERCLALVMYWEAKAEGAEGMIAVGAVVLNRVRHEEFPDTICGVVSQGGEQPPCQFSWWCDGKSDQPQEAEAWSTAVELARAMVVELPYDPTLGSLFFHASSIKVPWRVERERTLQIGQHIYYR